MYDTIQLVVMQSIHVRAHTSQSNHRWALY